VWYPHAAGGQPGETGPFHAMSERKKYMVVITTTGYERRIVEAESEEQAREKAAVGIGEKDGFEYGLPDPKESWKVYDIEE